MILGMGERSQLTVGSGESAGAESSAVPSPRHPPATRGAVLWPAVTALVICLFWTVAESTRLGVPAPFEDAAMLFKYAENTANGWGITWNPGQAPGATDGATDLGFVLVLAALKYLGVPAVIGALLTNLAAVFGIGALFGVLNAKLWHRSVWLPVGVAAMVASGPANRYVLSGFSPPVMAFLLLLAFTLAALAARSRSERHALALFAFAGAAAGAAGWWRPEGFAFAPLVVLLGILVTSRRDESRPFASPRVWAALLAPYAVLIAGWAVVRVAYFGQLLPTSAVMKSGSFHGENALFSIQFYASLLLPVIGALVVVVLGRGSSRDWWLTWVALTASLLWVGSAVPQDFWGKFGLSFVPTLSAVATAIVFVPLMLVLAVAGVKRRDGAWLLPAALLLCSVAWVAMATTLNWWGRMQWPLVPVLAAVAVHLVDASTPRSPAQSTRDRVRRTRTVVLALLTCVGVAPFHLPIGNYFESPFQTNVSAALKAVDTSRVRIATTEAGLIPLAVTGPALDTYGHNNRAIALSRGQRLTAELEAFQPNVLAVHGLPPDYQRVDGCSSQQRADQSTFSPRWSQMVADIYAYAERNALALTRISQTTPCETWSLWVSPSVDASVRDAVDEVEMPGTEVAVSSPPSRP